MPSKYFGKCDRCDLPCGHIFVSHSDMDALTHTTIDNLESGCSHFQGLEICGKCRQDMVSHIWRLAKGESIETVEV